MTRTQSESGLAAGAARRGILTMELVMTLPILGIVLFALFEFSLLMFARGSVVEASRAGARMASLPGADAEAIEWEVRKVLNPRLQDNLQVQVDVGGNSGDVVSVIVTVAADEASPDLLWPIGYSLRGRTLVAETRMIRE